MTVYAHDTQFFTRRGAVFLTIVGLHAFIAWALATGLARRALEVIAPPIQTDIVEEVKTEKEPPPPPPPDFEKPPVEVPPPDVQIQMPVEAPATTAITAVAATNKPPPPVVHYSSKTPPKGKRFPDTEDYYPAASKRLGEEGVATVRMCVAPNGKLAEAPAVTRSSGSARLDEGALNLAKAASYTPGTEDGKPVLDCFSVNIRFKLTNK
jgi:protein TonB